MSFINNLMKLLIKMNFYLIYQFIKILLLIVNIKISKLILMVLKIKKLFIKVTIMECKFF